MFDNLFDMLHVGEILRAINHNFQSRRNMSASALSSIKWATLITIPVLAVATWREWYFVWGLLFVYWGIGSVFSGNAFLVEPLTRNRNPLLYWLVTAAWIGFGAAYVAVDFLHRL